MDSDRRAHWEQVYRTRGDQEVSWYQADPTRSLDLILSVATNRGRILDIGGGTSVLVDRLLDRGFTPLAVLDISAAALDRAKARLGARAAEVEWICADITTMPELGTCEVWHDRAVFHFLTEHDDRASYATLAKRTVQLGGHMIVSTFAKDGPPRCSGLDVRRYAADELAACFPGFRLVSGANEVHVTPFQSRQSFVYAVLKRE